MKILLAAIIGGIGLVHAAETPVVDMEARKASVETLRKHIDQREKRLAEVVSDIRGRGQATDAKIEELVKMLSELKDSQDSKRRVSQLKAEVVAGLRRMIGVYQSERSKISEQLRSRNPASADALKEDTKVIDGLVEKRAEDIVALVKSMPGGEDVAKYETAGETWFDGVYYENSRITEAWRQNRRDKVQTEKLRREARQALEKAIADLTRRIAASEAALSEAGISAAEKEIQQQEVDRMSGVLKQRQAQLTEVSTPSDAPEETASMDEANDLKRLFADARADISADFNKTLRLYHAAAAEREKIAELKGNLEARIKWLEEHKAGGGKTE